MYKVSGIQTKLNNIYLGILAREMGPLHRSPADLVVICDEICGGSGCAAIFCIFYLFFLFGADNKHYYHHLLGSFSHLIIIAAAAYYAFNMYELCLVVFMPAFCGQTVNLYLFLAIS